MKLKFNFFEKSNKQIGVVLVLDMYLNEWWWCIGGSDVPWKCGRPIGAEQIPSIGSQLCLAAAAASEWDQWEGTKVWLNMIQTHVHA